MTSRREDQIKEFLADCITYAPCENVANRDMWEAFRAWCEGRQRGGMGRKSFTQTVRACGVEQRRCGAREWLNVTILDEEERDERAG